MIIPRSFTNDTLFTFIKTAAFVFITIIDAVIAKSVTAYLLVLVLNLHEFI